MIPAPSCARFRGTRSVLRSTIHSAESLNSRSQYLRFHYGYGAALFLPESRQVSESALCSGMTFVLRTSSSRQVVTEGLVSEKPRSEAGLDQDWSSSLRSLWSSPTPQFDFAFWPSVSASLGFASANR